MVLTYKFRLKDGGSKRKHLNRWASAVNFVWNYCNEASYQTLRKYSRWLSERDLIDLTSGVSKELGLNSQTIQHVCKEYVKKRVAARRRRLAWRDSKGSKRALGWIPATNQSVKVIGDKLKFGGVNFRFWKSRDIEGKIKAVSFNEDARGRWYVNLMCEIEEGQAVGSLELGVDLGLKTQATLSDGRKYERENLTRAWEDRLALAQKAGKKRRVKAIHAKIANIRKDWNHKTANAMIEKAALLVVGDVNSKKLAKTRLAKSVQDAAWSQLRSFLEYKCRRQGTIFKEVNESWTSRTCSKCGSIGDHRGLTGLSVRAWSCSSCGTEHDRDVNAARNILKLGLGHQTPIKGILTL